MADAMGRMRNLMGGDRWIPWTFVGGFAVILLANGIMVFSAFDSWTGVSTRDAYRRGLEYNRQLELRRQAAAVGWQISARVDGSGLTRTIRVALADRDGRPLTGADVTARFERPIERGMDVAVTLTGDRKGRYAGQVTLPRFGQWRVVYSVTAGGKTVAATKRYILKP